MNVDWLGMSQQIFDPRDQMNMGCSGSDSSFHLMAETISCARISLEKLIFLKLTLPWVVLNLARSAGGAEFTIK